MTEDQLIQAVTDRLTSNDLGVGEIYLDADTNGEQARLRLYIEGLPGAVGKYLEYGVTFNGRSVARYSSIYGPIVKVELLGTNVRIYSITTATSR